MHLCSGDGRHEILETEIIMTLEQDVINASMAFYRALNKMANGTTDSMVEIWAEGDVTAFHPIGGRDDGYDTTIDSFNGVAGIANKGDIAITEQTFHVTNDMACEVGREVGTLTLAGIEVAIDQRVTNIYRREDAGWKIVHHHTDLSSSMVDLVKRLQAS